MADLQFNSIDDLWDEDSGLAAAEREQHKYQGTSTKTSASTQGRSTTMSTLTTAEMLMQIPVYGSGTDVAATAEKVIESYTVGSIAGEANDDGSLGPIDELVPPDTKDLAKRLRDERLGVDTSATDPISGVTSEGADTTTSGKTLLLNPNCQFQSSGGGSSARKQIEEGKLSPNMIFILSKITQKLKIFISSGNTGQHASGSLHYSNKAIDIGSVVDPVTGAEDGFSSGKRSAVALSLYDVLNAITGPRRPTKVGGPFNPGWSDGRTIWFTNAEHGNHVHIEHGTWGEEVLAGATGNTGSSIQPGVSQITSSGGTPLNVPGGPQGMVARVLQVAVAEIGTTESPAGSNKTKYGAWYGVNGQPWCAIFISWVWDQAGTRFAMDSSKGFSYTPSGYTWFQNHNQTTTSPVSGDIAFFDFPDTRNRIQHVGIVESVTTTTVTCIEGNTSATATGSQYNGGSVNRRTRPRQYVVGFGRPAYAKTS